MSDLKVHPLSQDEVDGLDESAVGVPVPNTASGFVTDFALPGVLPKRVHPLAVVALVLALVLPFVAIPVAHRVIRTLQHEGGRGLAVAQAAIVVGYIDILLWALVCLNLAVAVLLHPAVG
ncbi:MAG: hypothetical protein ACTHJI_05345 [Leifsonia sp.]|jgi:hypothetical protein